MKYYEIESYTPYCGEESYDYFATDNEKELHKFAQRCCEENALEWIDDEYLNPEDEEAYFAECGYNIKEIDYLTWKEEMLKYGSC